MQFCHANVVKLHGMVTVKDPVSMTLQLSVLITLSLIATDYTRVNETR